MGFLDIFKKKQVNKKLVKSEDEYELQEELVDDIYKYNDKFININLEVEDMIIKEILTVVKANDSFNDLKVSSEIAANNIGYKYIDLLPQYLNGKIEKPNELIGIYDDSSSWQIAVDNSILMIIFSYKEKAVETLSKIAYGNTSLKIKAINLLIRLAAENIETDKIVDDIMNNIMEFTDYDKITIFGFASQIKGNSKIIALIQHFYKEFLRNEDVENAYHSLVYLINTAQRWTTGHLNLLKAMVIDGERIDLRKVIDIKEGEKDFISTTKISDITKIKAALTFYNMNKEDEEINNKLIYWSKNYNDLEVRNEIKKVFESK
ncbi:MAG: hypothetical protein RSC24_15325 [Clostridium sp.]